MATTLSFESTRPSETPNLEMHWTSEDGCLRSRWNITLQPVFDRVEKSRRIWSDWMPGWLKSACRRTSTTRHATLEVHSTRLLHALCWFIFLL